MATRNDKTFDLIIVGAGPAGAIAALYAKRHGLTTLLLDREKFPRDKVCGDALSGKTVTILDELDLVEKVSKLPGALVQKVIFGSPDHVEVSIDLRRSNLKRVPTGFVIRRKVLDEFLFGEAREAAGECIEEFTVRDLVREDGLVRGVRGRRAGDDADAEFRGHLVLGADGFNSIVARKAGLYKHDPDHWVVAMRCYYENVKGLTDQIELHYVDEVIPGYFWIFPVDNGYANVGIGMLHKYIKDKKINLRAAMQNAIDSEAFRDRFAEAEPIEAPAGWNLPVGSKHRKIYGPGFMLLGDAASLIDPFTGEGIGNAMYSAKYAVEAAREAVDAGDFSEGFLTRYDERLWNEIGDELNVSAKLQKIGRVRALLNFVINKAAKNPELRDVIGGMIANEVPRHQLSNPLFYLKLLFT